MIPTSFKELPENLTDIFNDWENIDDILRAQYAEDTEWILDCFLYKHCKKIDKEDIEKTLNKLLVLDSQINNYFGFNIKYYVEKIKTVI